MENLAQMFGEGSKVVISPDEMRAWVMLPKPQKDCPYTEEGLRAWLLENGVTHGLRDDMIKKALLERKSDELMEVARGTDAQEGTDGYLQMHVKEKENASVRTGSDGGLILDDLSFLHEVPAGKVLAEVMPAIPGTPGYSVNGHELPTRHSVKEADALEGSGFEKSDDGLRYSAPVRSHVRFVNGTLVLTPVTVTGDICADDGPLSVEGNLVVEGDILAGSVLAATGSVYVSGKSQEATIDAGRNILLCGGMHSMRARGTLTAKENIWGQLFEQASLHAGSDVCATVLRGCEVTSGGQVRVLGKQGQISGCEVYATSGVVCQTLGGDGDNRTEIHVGMKKSLLSRNTQINQSIEKRNQDVQQILQNMATIEKLNRQKPTKGKDLPEYLEMVQKKDATLKVLRMLEQERQNLKRKMDALSAAGVVARVRVHPGVLISIDTREYHVDRKLGKVRFKRDGEYIELITAE